VLVWFGSNKRKRIPVLVIRSPALRYTFRFTCLPYGTINLILHVVGQQARSKWLLETLRKAEEIVLAIELTSNHVVNTYRQNRLPAKLIMFILRQGINSSTLLHILASIVVVTNTKRHLPIESFPVFNCGKRGHLAKACRNKPSARPNKGFELRKREQTTQFSRRQK